MKKKIKVGTISGLDLIKKTRPPQDIPFRVGNFATKKDRPRDKSYKRSVNYENY